MDHCRLLLAFALAFSSFNGCKAQACANQPYLPRIVGGTEATPHSWPWIITLSYNDTDPYCGGSLISELWVLTAAHCVNPERYENHTIILGRHFVSNLTGTVSRDIDAVFCHPGYNLSQMEEHDICLLKMSAPVEYTDYIQPVCLAAEGSIFPSGLSSWVAGWGALDESGEGFPDTLQKVKVPVVGLNECRCLNRNLYIPETTICAGYSEGEKDSCYGDSGGPLVVRKSTVWIQAGIVSFGEGCARKDRPGVYNLVSVYQDWISEVMGDPYPAGFVLFEPKEEDSDVHYVCQNKSALYHYYYNSTFLMDHGVRLHSGQLLSVCAVVLAVAAVGLGYI